MQRLTPTKCRFTLPDKRLRLNVGGNTSIIYATGNPDMLEIYTIERVKFEYWQHGLGITDTYDYAGDAFYCGFSPYTNDYRREYIPVYKAITRRLDMPNDVQMKHVRKIQKKISETMQSVPWRYKMPVQELNLMRWNALSGLANMEIPELVLPVEFIMDNSNPENIFPDFGPGDFAVMNNEIVVLDPFHAVGLQDYFRLRKRR